MARPLPSSLPPVELHDRILAVLLPQLHLPNTLKLRTVLQILASQSLHSPGHAASSKPLQLALKLSSTASTSEVFDIETLVDLVWAYPNHINAVSTILTRRFDAEPILLERFSTTIIPSLVDSLNKATANDTTSVAVKALGALIRAHDDILSLVVQDPSSILSALREVYGRLKGDDGLKVKEDILLLVERIMAGLEHTTKSPLELLGSKNGEAFVNGSLRTDYEAIFDTSGSAISLNDNVIARLRAIQDDKTKANAVLNVASLFPYIPTHLVQEALDHSAYSGAPQPLVEAILGGGFQLPAELRELRAVVTAHTDSHEPGNGADASASSSRPKRTERRNIWQDEQIDMSRLKIKDHSDEAIATVAGTEIPNHLRDSILRLVENQAIEAEEQARALAEAHGTAGPSHEVDGVEQDEEDARQVRVAGEGDASGDEDAEGDKDRTVDKTRRPPREATWDPNLQIKLELAYLTNPAIFDRGSEVRRSEGRHKLRDATGMDDSQLEGWRVMLERNPHKEAILGRHQVIPPEYQAYLPKAGRGRGGGGVGKGKGREDTAASSRDGSVRGDGESSRGSGRGGQGARGGGGGGGGGGGRGRGGAEGGGRGRGQNKGSRGHSNAARTRGHDKKMARMGAGI